MTDNQQTFRADTILAEIAKATSLPAIIEMTGGWVATIYIGYPGPDDRYLLAMGPGSFNPRDENLSMFYPDDFSVGPDDDGQGESIDIQTLDDIVPAVQKALLDLDEAFRITFPEEIPA